MLYPKAAACIGIGALGGFAGGYLYIRNLRRTRLKVLKAKGRKYLENDDVMHTSVWVENTSKVRRQLALTTFLGSILGLNYTTRTYYPEYMQDVASMPNSPMALAIKRMHRQYELHDNVQLRSVSQERIKETETVFASKEEHVGAKIPTELAATRSLTAGMGGGYRAGGS